MKFGTYVNRSGRGTLADIARQEGVSPVTVLGWAKGRKPVPLARAPSIESYTGGLVTVEELWPDQPWLRIKDRRWPHRGGRPVLDFASRASL